MNSNDVSATLRVAIRENSAAATADPNFVHTTVAACGARLDEDEPSRMTADDAARQARLYRTIAAYAVRGAILFERRASLMSSQRQSA